MNLNFLSILTAIIAPPAVEAPALDDTQPMPAIVEPELPVVRLVSLDSLFPFTLSELVKCRVQYAHFDSTRELFTGRVVGFSATQLQILPDAVPGCSLLTKWRSIDDVTGVFVEGES